MPTYKVFTAIEEINASTQAHAYYEWVDTPTHPVIVEETVPMSVENPLGFIAHEFTWFPTAPTFWTLDMIVESLYNFDNDQLRKLATECLLITDGPDKREEEA